MEPIFMHFFLIFRYLKDKWALCNKFHHKYDSDPIYYVGYISDTAPSGTLLSRENFKGCIRNVVIRNELKDWTDMDDLHNVLLSECLAIN